MSSGSFFSGSEEQFGNVERQSTHYAASSAPQPFRPPENSRPGFDPSWNYGNHFLPERTDRLLPPFPSSDDHSFGVDQWAGPLSTKKRFSPPPSMEDSFPPQSKRPCADFEAASLLSALPHSDPTLSLPPPPPSPISVHPRASLLSLETSLPHLGSLLSANGGITAAHSSTSQSSSIPPAIPIPRQFKKIEVPKTSYEKLLSTMPVLHSVITPSDYSHPQLPAAATAGVDYDSLSQENKFLRSTLATVLLAFSLPPLTKTSE